MAYSAQSMYRPAVAPDTEGISRGIAGAGNAIAGALGTYAGWQQQNKVREDQQAHESGLAQQRFDLESALVDKRMDRDLAMFGMEQDAKKQERELEKAMADEQTRYANAGMMAFLNQLGASEDMIAAGMNLPEKSREPFLKAALHTKLKEVERQQQLSDEIAGAMIREQMKPPPDPRLKDVLTEDGKPTGYGVPYDGSKVLGGAMAKAGPQSRTTAPRPAPKQLRQIDIDGRAVSVLFDPNTGEVEPVKVPAGAAPGISADPSDAIRSILQQRPR